MILSCHKHHSQHSQAFTLYHGVTLTHRQPIFGPNLTAHWYTTTHLFHLTPRFRTITTHFCHKSSPCTTLASLKSRRAVLSNRFFTCRFKNSIFEQISPRTHTMSAPSKNRLLRAYLFDHLMPQTPFSTQPSLYFIPWSHTGT